MIPLVLTLLVLLTHALPACAQTFDCPLGWDEFGDECYLFQFYPPRVYAEALAACQIDGASLVSINGPAEHQFISQWLTKNDANRRDAWYTSGSGDENLLHWAGDGTTVINSLDWWLDEQDSNATNQIIVYIYSVSQGSFGWARSPRSEILPYVCEISKSEAFRINKAVRDYTYGQDITDPNSILRGPKFLTHPRDLVIVGREQTVGVECIASGNPPPSYKWFKNQGSNNTEVTSLTDSRYTITNGMLTIQEPKEDIDIGIYQCKAENSVGVIISDPIDVSFGYLYEFSNDPPGAVRAPLYQGTVIMCMVPAYNPALTYQWYKNDAAHFIRPQLNDYQFISHNGNLYMSEVQQSDAGQYHCVVTLSVPSGERLATSQPPSRTSLGIQLMVTGESAMDFGPTIHNDFPAVFPSPPLRGQDIRLECMAYGKMPLYYSWTRTEGDGDLGLPHNSRLEDHNRVLLIDNARIEDGGNYTCHVTRGSSAADSKSLYVSLSSRPYFIFPLRDQFIDVGSQLTWRCLANAVPAPNYIWYKNTVMLTSTPGDVEISGNVLKIFAADAKRHNGMYQCSARNINGQTFSTAELKVLSFAPQFNKMPVQDSIGTIGGNVTLVCQPEAAPTPEMQWIKDGRDLGLSIGGGGRVQLLHNGNLFISSLVTGDGGSYKCTASNDLGSASSEASLLVSEHTEISSPPSDTSVIVNNTAFLYCEASYDVTTYDLVYEWFFNDHPLDIQHNPYFVQGVRGHMRGLYIRNAQFTHVGEYSCRAITVKDQVAASAMLTVLGPPSEPAGVYAIHEGKGLNLHWSPGNGRGSAIIFYTVEYNTNFNKEWRIMEDHLSESEVQTVDEPAKRTTRLEEDLLPGIGYKFRVRAANMYGIGDASNPSSVYEMPSAAPAVVPEMVGGGGGTVGTLVITWQILPAEAEGGRGIGYYVYWRMKEKDDGRWMMGTVTGRQGQYVTIEGVGTDNYYLQYEVMVGAFNSYGAGPNSSIAVIYSAEGMPYGTPTNIWIDTYNATAIVVYFNHVEDTREAVKGKIIGYQVNFWVDGQDDPLLRHSYHYGQRDSAIVIGCTPNFDYWADVQVFNSAGLGPESEINFGSSAGEAPNAYPEYVEIHSHGPNSVYVNWRGISTVPIIEEALQGYKLRYWPATEDLRKAKDVVVENKRTWGVIDDIEKGVVYKLRVTGYSVAGDGEKAPPVFFTLGGQVQFDYTTTEIRAGGNGCLPCLVCVALSLSFWCALLLW